MESPRNTHKTIWRDLVIAMAGAFAYRLVFMLAMPRVLDTADAIHYLTAAKQIGAGAFLELDSRITLLYPALTALCALVVDDVEWAARVVSFIAATLFVVPAYLVSHDMHGRAAARITALTVCLWPWLADYGCRVGPEAVSLLLWFTAIWVIARGMRNGRAWPICAAVVLFLLHLTRPEGTVLLLAAPVAFLLLESRPWPKRLVRWAPYLIVTCVLLAGYALAMRNLTGVVSISARIESPTGTLHHIFVERGEDMARAFLKLSFNVLPVMLGPFLLPFAGVGVFTATAQSRNLRIEALVAYFALVQFSCAVLSTYSEPRYLMPVVVAVAMWSANGMAIVSDSAANAVRYRAVRHLPVVALVLLMALGTSVALLPEYMGRTPRVPREYKIAGQWMKDNLEPGLIFTRKPQVGFYAEMRSTGPLPTDSVEEAIARAREAGARYFVVDERYTAQMAPGLAPLLDPAQAPPELRLLKEGLSPYPDAGIVIYELKAHAE